MKILIDIPLDKCTLNNYILVERKNKFAGAKMKKDYTGIIAMVLPKINIDKCDIVFNWYKKDNKQDHDNIDFCKKFILDAMVNKKLIKNDGSKYIGNFKSLFHNGKKGYLYCELEILEYDSLK